LADAECQGCGIAAPTDGKERAENGQVKTPSRTVIVSYADMDEIEPKIKELMSKISN
jgi:hypothetical protein